MNSSVMRSLIKTNTVEGAILQKSRVPEQLPFLLCLSTSADDDDYGWN